MGKDGFFEEQTVQSGVKSAIVAKYFDAWASVIMSVQDRKSQAEQRIAYIDLFAGPGRYDDGTRSTPVKVVQMAVSNPKLRQRLVTIFNDLDTRNCRSLESELAAIPDVQKLAHPPLVQNAEVGEGVVRLFETMSFVPTLFFVDPWGYKGLSLRLINSVLKDWGCDCVFFFNYNRINMGINNEFVLEHMDALFGTERAGNLRGRLEGMDPQSRELTIVEELCQALREYGNRFVLPFRFRNAGGSRTSHHLIFVSKSSRGYEIMKDIMGRESSSRDEGVPSFEYSPADFLPKQALLFKLSQPVAELKKDLLRCFAGRKLKMVDVFREHHVDTPYVKSNYKQALLALEGEGIISATGHRRKGTLGDSVVVIFPRSNDESHQA